MNEYSSKGVTPTHSAVFTTILDGLTASYGHEMVGVPLIANVVDNVAVKSAEWPERTLSSSGKTALIGGEMVGSEASSIVLGVAVAVSVETRQSPEPVITAEAFVPSDSPPDSELLQPAIHKTTTAAAARSHCTT
ncbi:MAG: hypothetical protein KIS78_06170 [Labilithrix sp.]|nr:hypothetical protein [Labilithrix sp.]MCW5832023.1 hypothetical protein [Labilithrix sp.]